MLEGKGIFVWKIHQVAGGDVRRMADRAKAAGLSHVLLKIADGVKPYNADLAGPATQALQAEGIQAWGWAWVWLEDPSGEARVAADRVTSLGMDGFVINAEHPAKGRHQQVQHYMQVLREQLSDAVIGLSSYRYPQYHSTLPWREFLSQCDFNMPQMYWVGETPTRTVSRSLGGHQALPVSRPILATGAAYGEQYGSYTFRAQPHQIVEFLDAVREQGIPAANFWSWDWTEANSPALWSAIANYDWPLEPVSPQTVAGRYWRALVTGDLASLAGLYHLDAVHIAAGHTVQGPPAIRGVVAELLAKLTEAEFTQESIETVGNVCFLRWSARSVAARVRNGLETIGVRAGKIQYHASSYQLVTS